MSNVKGAFRNHLRERPFDFYVALVLFLVGAYAVFSPSWPEKNHIPQVEALINIVSIYMMIASSIVMSSLLCNRKNNPVYAILAEMWGWFAISAASFAVTLMYFAQYFYGNTENIAVSIIFILIWFGMFVASGFRSLDVFLVIRGRR